MGALTKAGSPTVPNTKPHHQLRAVTSPGPAPPTVKQSLHSSSGQEPGSVPIFGPVHTSTQLINQTSLSLPPETGNF